MLPRHRPKLRLALLGGLFQRKPDARRMTQGGSPGDPQMPPLTFLSGDV